MIGQLAFTCVDCGLRKQAIPDAQVVFGRQRLSGREGVLVGRCLPCGIDLPAIDEDRPFFFRFEEDEYQISVAWAFGRKRWVYSLNEPVRTSLPAELWRPLRVFELDALRNVLTKLALPPVSVDEVLDVHRRLNDLAPEEVWPCLTGAEP